MEENNEMKKSEIVAAGNAKIKGKGILKFILNVIRYVIGGFIILINLFDLPSFYSIVGILFGLSLLPNLTARFLNKFNKLKKVKKDNEIKIIISAVIFIIWIAISPGVPEEPNNPNDNLNDSTNKTESSEQLFLKTVSNKLSTNQILNSYTLDKITGKYDISIKETASLLSSYTCASNTQELAKDLLGNDLVKSVTVECINDTGTFNFIKIDNFYSLTIDSLNDATTYYDKDFNQIDTNLETLKANRDNDYKKSCSSYEYKDTLRNPDKYMDKKAYWFGEIVQVITKTSYYSTFRINVSCEKYYYSSDYYCSDTIYVTYYGSESFIEDDMVKMWGTMNGVQTYTTVLGASVTIPKFTALYMELQ